MFGQINLTPVYRLRTCVHGRFYKYQIKDYFVLIDTYDLYLHDRKWQKDTTIFISIKNKYFWYLEPDKIVSFYILPVLCVDCKTVFKQSRISWTTINILIQMWRCYVSYICFTLEKAIR